LLASLAGCAISPSVPPPTLPKATQVVRPPPPEPEVPPLPLHKPLPPHPAGATPADQIAKADLPASALPPGSGDSAAPGDTPVPPDTPPPSLVGLDEASLNRALGAPNARRDSPPAVVWHYVDGDCIVDVYLYRDVETDLLHALYIELNGDDRTEQRRQLCLRRLAGHADRPDPSAPR
jgi:hypothetical protein